MMTFEENETPARERRTVSGGVQFGAMLGTAIAFGFIEEWGETWPAWAFYPPKLLLAFCVRLGLGIAFEKSGQFGRDWKSLYWRVLCFEGVVWSWSLVFFLAALHAGEKKNGFMWLLVAGAAYFVTLSLAKRLISTFRCPHCRQFFFNRKGIKEAEGLFPFALRQWPNTLCQHCSWPLWKSVRSELKAELE